MASGKRWFRSTVVVGATGAVGTVTLELLREHGYADVRAFASARSAGKRINDLTVEEATPEALSAGDLDLCLFSVGTDAPGPERGRVGLYHLAWEVPSIHDLAAGRDTLARLGALVGQSDHGATKSLYGRDPDGNEFEIMWLVPREQWGDLEHEATTDPLDLDAELARWG